jgi:2-keto-4-pentenoate hydratase/2-oxohepta-3-ene-1,7-dioic acid hydratase in catechol pathway
VRFATVSVDGDERVGVVVGEEVRLHAPGPRLVDLLADEATLREAGERAARRPSGVVALAEAALRAPVPAPPSVRDFYAFEQHVATARRARGLDMDPDWYELPVFYFSNPHAIYGPEATVPGAPGSRALDYELEVAAVVVGGGANLSPEEAERCIGGFTVMNDWSARDLQQREMRQMLGPAKGKDFATSLGPVLVTPDELADVASGNAYALEMTATVNGRECSRASLADIYWSFPELLSYAARGTRLAPGDVIGSGTCGTGCLLELSLVHGSDRYPWLEEGDVVECRVERLGTLRNVVGAAPPLRPLRPGDGPADAPGTR